MDKPKLKPVRPFMQIIPLTIVIGCLLVAFLQYNGTIDIRGLLKANNIEELPSIPPGVPYSHDFSDELIPLLGPESNPSIYTFYLGSGVGFPPMGLILGPDGVLKGTPTGKGGKFQVCVKDAGGRSACKTYFLDVVNKDNPIKPKTCPVTSCDTGSCCHSVDPNTAVDGIVGSVAAVLTKNSCECPSDTTFYSMDTTSAGGPWKVCICK